MNMIEAAIGVVAYLLVGGVVGYYIGFARGTHHGFILGRTQGIRMIRDALSNFGVFVGILETRKGELAGLTIDRTATTAAMPKGEG